MQDPNNPHQREAAQIHAEISALMPRVSALLRKCERNQQQAEACDNAFGALDEARDQLSVFD